MADIKTNTLFQEGTKTLIIIKLLEIVFIDTIFTMIDGRVFQHLGIPTLLLFSSLCSFSRLKQGSHKKIEKELARSFISLSAIWIISFHLVILILMIMLIAYIYLIEPQINDCIENR